MPLGIPDTRAFPWDQSLKSHLGQLNNGVTGGINTWAVNPTVGVDGLALGTNHAGYTGINTSTSNIERWDGTAWGILTNSSRMVTGNNINFYVNQSSGSDSNNGMSSSTAWKTTSKLYQEMRTYVYQEREVNIFLGSGMYNLEFPSNTRKLTINIIGASSATVNLSSMRVTDQTVSIKGLTVATPGLTGFSTRIMVLGAGVLRVGPDIVLGDCGPDVSYFYIRDGSQLILSPNSPVTVTNNCHSILYLYNSWSTFTSYQAPAVPIAGAPILDKGIVYSDIIPSLNVGETTSTINFVGNRTVLAVMVITNTSKIEGQTGGMLNITGSVTGLSYICNYNSYINGSTHSGVASTSGSIGFSTSLTGGTLDSTSYVVGTRNI